MLNEGRTTRGCGGFRESKHWRFLPDRLTQIFYIEGREGNPGLTIEVGMRRRLRRARTTPIEKIFELSKQGQPGSWARIIVDHSMDRVRNVHPPVSIIYLGDCYHWRHWQWPHTLGEMIDSLEGIRQEFLEMMPRKVINVIDSHLQLHCPRLFTTIQTISTAFVRHVTHAAQTY